MRWIALVVVFVGSPAWAGEPATCDSLAESEQTFDTARDEVSRLIGVAFGDDFDRRLAYVDPDERDDLLEQRESARKDLPGARKVLRQARRGAKQARKSVRQDGVVCEPPAVAAI